MSDPGTDPLAALRRWEDFGGEWEVVARSGDWVTVSLRRCDGGEEASRLVTDDPALIQYVDRSLGRHRPRTRGWKSSS